jgi:predicted MPP superfamily phosphohydrolase
MSIRILLFLIFTFAIYFGIHAFLWFSFVKFFSISNQLTRTVLVVALGFLSISFILSAILIHITHIFIARAYYYLSGFWIGFAIYLFIIFIIFWVVHFGLSKAGLDFNSIIGASAIILALIITLHGAWNAMNPVVKNIDITINNLPSDWKNKRIIQISDVHLGAINGINFMERVVERINSLNPYIVVITGDLFDGMGSHPDNYIDILNKLNTEKGIYFATGNHETYIGRDNALSALKQTKINVLDNEMALVSGMQIIGISFPDFNDNNDRKNIISEIPGYSKDIPSILLYHEPTNLDQGEGKNSTWHAKRYLAPDTDFSIQKQSGIDLQLSGHTHAGQFFPFNIITKWIFNGYHYGLFGIDNFQLYVSSGTGTWGMPIRNSHKSEIVSIILE